MRLFPSLLLVLALFSACSSAQRRPDAEAPAEPGPAAVGASASGETQDPGVREVFDPVAAPTGDHFVAAPPVVAEADRPNTLAPGFLIRLVHQEDRDLNGSFRIDFDGKINLPYNVSLRAQGLTLEEFRQKVMEAYRPFYKSGLRLSVDLVERAYLVELRGLIKKPGRYKVRADTSLDEVISMGDGFPAAAESQPRYIKITRGDATRVVNLEDYYKSGSLKANSPWHGGEVIFFQKESANADPNSLEVGNQVQVLGELKRPGEFGHRAGADVYFYMAEAGGPTRDTDFDKVQIYRGLPGKRVMMEFELEDPTKVPAVRPGDILVFHSDKPTRFQKNVTTAANIASVITAIALLIIAL